MVNTLTTPPTKQNKTNKHTYSITIPLSHAPQFPCLIHGSFLSGFTSTISAGGGSLLNVSTYWYGISLTSSAIQMRCAKGQKELPKSVRLAGLAWRRAVCRARPEEKDLMDWD